MNLAKSAALLSTASLLVLAHAAPALAADAAATDTAQANAVEEIVVTAQKRSEAVNTVPMSITAVSGDNLRQQGVSSTDDLAKVVPGFTFTKSAYSAPVYSLRGVGYYDYAIGAAPTVSVYVDEAPLPFSTMTRGAAFDLDRVEVLKGPQGTLFGANSTGGAINYVAAKPTQTFASGVDASYGRFNQFDVGGFVSGPINEAVSSRLAVRHEGGGDWQQSTTRNDTLGAKDFTEGRFLLDFHPTDRLKVQVDLNGFVDKSDAQAAQVVQVNPLIPGLEDPRIYSEPLAHDARMANWSPTRTPKRDDTLFQAVGRIDYTLTDAVTLTSLTSYSNYRQHDFVDPDGTALVLADTQDDGHINAFFEELRLSGDVAGRARWIVGANYELNRVGETQYLSASDASGFRLFNFAFGIPTPDTTPIYANERFKTLAAYGNLDYDLGDKITLHGGVRYTKTDISYSGCTGDSANGSLGTGISIILGSLGVPVSFPPGSCTTLDANLQPAESHQQLNQDNVSWRVGVDFKPADHTLLYANISRGFKAGSFPTLPATSTAQYVPVTQEELTAYETGFKIALLDRSMQVNGALFYYDYKNKQMQGSVILTPNIFGPLNDLVNIPKSTVKGAELQVTWVPVRGLTLNAGGAYLDTSIGDFTNFDPYGVLRNFKGEAFPNTPKWQATADAQYTWPVSSSLDAFVGGNLTYHSSANAQLGDYPILAIDSYALLDLRAGLASGNDAWRLTFWGRNVTNKYYWTNAYKIADITSRFAGMPATYGVSISARF